MSKPVVHLYALNWNERPLLPYFFEHYRTFVDQFFIFDDGSDDGSVEYLGQQPDVVLGSFVKNAESYIEPAREFYNSAWKASRGAADWVIVVNIDEFVHHPAPIAALARLRKFGHTIVQAVGWQMVAPEFPASGPLATTVPMGVRTVDFDKFAIFDPNAIDDIGYGPGRHTAMPSGRVRVAADSGFNLLHFKYLGADYTVRRYAELNARRGDLDRSRGWGRSYERSPDEVKKVVGRLAGFARPVLVENAVRLGHAEQVLPGCLVITPRDVQDARGGLREVWMQGETWGPEVRHIYLTTALPGAVKAWYRHLRQTDHVMAVSGAVRFVLFDTRDDQPPGAPAIVELNSEQPKILIVPPHVWHGFQNLGETPALLLHHNNNPYHWSKPDEDRLPPDTDQIPYRWAT